MNYHGWNTQGERREETYRRHVEDAAEIVRGVIERGCSVRVIGGEIDDQGAVRDVYERVCSLGKSYADRCTAPSLLDFDDLFRELGECDLVIATRFHNVVCSLILGKPVLSVGYADKNRDLLKEFGLGEYAHDIETLSVGRLLEQFDEVVGRRVELERSIACTARRYRVEIRGYMDGLWETLGL
jgi:polysaccharide pyruvyl transferase WcaK-like protein